MKFTTGIQRVKASTVIAELRRLRIVWRMRSIDVLERRAATELAYERAHVTQTSQNFNALLVSNQQLREVYQKQLQSLTEDA